MRRAIFSVKAWRNPFSSFALTPRRVDKIRPSKAFCFEGRIVIIVSFGD